MTPDSRHTRIAGTGSYLPPRRLSNADLVQPLGRARHRDQRPMDRRAHRHPSAALCRCRGQRQRPGGACRAPCAGGGRRPRRRGRPDHRRHLDAGHGVPVHRRDRAAQAGRARLSGLRRAGGVLRLRLCADRGRRDDPHRRGQHGAGHRRRGLLAHPRLQRPRHLRALRRRRRRGAAARQRHAGHPGHRPACRRPPCRHPVRAGHGVRRPGAGRPAAQDGRPGGVQAGGRRARKHRTHACSRRPAAAPSRWTG